MHSLVIASIVNEGRLEFRFCRAETVDDLSTNVRWPVLRFENESLTRREVMNFDIARVEFAPHRCVLLSFAIPTLQLLLSCNRWKHVSWPIEVEIRGCGMIRLAWNKTLSKAELSLGGQDFFSSNGSLFECLRDIAAQLDVSFALGDFDLC